MKRTIDSQRRVIIHHVTQTTNHNEPKMKNIFWNVLEPLQTKEVNYGFANKRLLDIIFDD